MAKAQTQAKAMAMGFGINPIRTTGGFPALALAASLAFGFSFARATDAPAHADKPAAESAQGVVAEKAIHADGGGDCAKAKEDCPKEAKADCCPKGVKGAKDGKGAGHGKHEHKNKRAEAKASPAGAADKASDKPAEADKGASHPG